MIFDQIELISKSTIQHGPNNDRVYLMKIHPDDNPVEIIESVERLADEKGYTKIFAKVPVRYSEYFLGRGFRLEALVPNFYKGIEDGCFLGKFIDRSRGMLSQDEQRLFSEVKNVSWEGSSNDTASLPPAYEIVELGEADLNEVALLYRKVFNVYPFPIFNEEYLLETMRDNVRYFGVRYEGDIVAVSSAEIDFQGSNVEMTDFATLPEFRGKNLSYILLNKMMSSVSSLGIRTAYTIARASSFGMNKTFGKSGFEFKGTLVNNTFIGESIESMNIWYKGV
ncbi:putative beta-lysine N-acetyltransferase (plasmid) [Fulvitalea axinellae]|uniref:Beta-lysine N-acetyltransferase n=1 Tax=Fulvitalea axinellae TaxID=1182444 RepID=A0AAU9D337_9BACT|nr:putative beta-lysine N-acetyltransferase [Fulvitalea axinellae]